MRKISTQEMSRLLNLLQTLISLSEEECKPLSVAFTLRIIDRLNKSLEINLSSSVFNQLTNEINSLILFKTLYPSRLQLLTSPFLPSDNNINNNINNNNNENCNNNNINNNENNNNDNNNENNNLNNNNERCNDENKEEKKKEIIKIEPTKEMADIVENELKNLFHKDVLEDEEIINSFLILAKRINHVENFLHKYQHVNDLISLSARYFLSCLNEKIPINNEKNNNNNNNNENNLNNENNENNNLNINNQNNNLNNENNNLNDEKKKEKENKDENKIKSKKEFEYGNKISAKYEKLSNKEKLLIRKKKMFKYIQKIPENQSIKNKLINMGYNKSLWDSDIYLYLEKELINDVEKSFYYQLIDLYQDYSEILVDKLNLKFIYDIDGKILFVDKNVLFYDGLSMNDLKIRKNLVVNAIRKANNSFDCRLSIIDDNVRFFIIIYNIFSQFNYYYYYYYYYYY